MYIYIQIVENGDGDDVDAPPRKKVCVDLYARSFVSPVPFNLSHPFASGTLSILVLFLHVHCFMRSSIVEVSLHFWMFFFSLFSSVFLILMFSRLCVSSCLDAKVPICSHAVLLFFILI